MGRHCGGDAVQGFGVDAVVGPFAALVAADEATVDEQFHVMRHRGLAQAEWFGEVADAGFSTIGGGDEGHQLDPGGVGEGFEHRGKSFGGWGVQHAAGQR